MMMSISIEVRIILQWKFEKKDKEKWQSGELMSEETWLIGSPTTLTVEIATVVDGVICDFEGVRSLVTLSLCVLDIEKFNN